MCIMYRAIKARAAAGVINRNVNFNFYITVAFKLKLKLSSLL